ncbi:hypothetical protein WG66_004268, partial [Moniliophthora roreri]
RIAKRLVKERKVLADGPDSVDRWTGVSRLRTDQGSRPVLAALVPSFSAITPPEDSASPLQSISSIKLGASGSSSELVTQQKQALDNPNRFPSLPTATYDFTAEFLSLAKHPCSTFHIAGISMLELSLSGSLITDSQTTDPDDGRTVAQKLFWNVIVGGPGARSRPVW